MMKRFLNGFVLEYPRLVLLILVVTIVFFGYQARKLEIDASAETLVLEDDKDLALSRLFNERFKTQDFLVITFTPEGDLLSEQNLDIIRQQVTARIALCK